MRNECVMPVAGRILAVNATTCELRNVATPWQSRHPAANAPRATGRARLRGDGCTFPHRVHVLRRRSLTRNLATARQATTAPSRLQRTTGLPWRSRAGCSVRAAHAVGICQLLRARVAARGTTRARSMACRTGQSLSAQLARQRGGGARRGFERVWLCERLSGAGH